MDGIIKKLMYSVIINLLMQFQTYTTFLHLLKTKGEFDEFMN